MQHDNCFKSPYNLHIDKKISANNMQNYEGFISHYTLKFTVKMLKSVDLYLGSFLILCGFIISILNLHSVMLRKFKYSSVLLSENIILMCIGIAFLSRAVYSLHPEDIAISDLENRMANGQIQEMAKCGISSLLLGYGPLIVSMVNSFLSLIIDNYMHYQMIIEMKKKYEENDVQSISLNEEQRSRNIKKLVLFFKQNFSIVSITLQWIIPIIIALSMVPMNVKEISMSEARKLDETCVTMLHMTIGKCLDQEKHNKTLVSIKQLALLPVNDIDQQSNSSNEVNTILDSVLSIIKNYENNSEFQYASLKSPRKPKLDDRCMEICITDNKHMLLYMFIIAFLGYFVPITLSTVILTKISVMKINKPNLKTYVSRELLYNVLFWTPVVFDTFLSLILCSYSMQGMRTSLFHVIANVYQAIKNFMNTKYFKDNSVVPV